MKIAFLIGKESMKTIFTERHLKQIAEFGEIVCYDGDDMPDADEARKIISGADIAITTWGSPQINEYLLNEAPNMKLLLHAAGSVKNYISPTLWERGIRVSNSAGPLGKGVAETALAFTLASLKHMWTLAKSCSRGEWREGNDKVREIFEVVIGVIGAGHAGRHYMHLMRQFEVQVLLYDPTLNEEQAWELGAKKVDLETLLKDSDVVSIHAPSIPATDKMLNSENLKLMKDDGILINTARGTIIDEEALLAELRKGRLFACLDVTYPEPPSVDHPFRSMQNVVLTPHIAGAVNNGKLRMGAHIANEIGLFIKGEPLAGEIKQESLGFIG